MKTSELICKKFELNNFICKVYNVDENFIYYSSENKSGTKFANARLDISWANNILGQQ